jgi:hypothetical protein
MYAWNHVKAFLGVADATPQPSNDEDALMLAVSSLDELTVTEEQARALKVPVLAVRGGPKDDPNDTVERLVAINPAVKMLRLETEDHISTVSSTPFRQTLAAFLAQHPPQ